jgi:hypothetical protein
MPVFYSMTLRPLLLFAFALLLSGCDLEALLADPRVVQREAEGKAIGSACRYAVRGIEDCYTLNDKALKTAIFAGWKEMDQYMRENKIEGQPSKIDKTVPAAAAMASDEAIVDDKKTTPVKADTKAAAKPKAAASSAPAKTAAAH